MNCVAISYSICCSVFCRGLQRVAVYSYFQHLNRVVEVILTSVCCRVLQCVAMYCSVLQCVAVCCNALQCVAVYSYSPNSTPKLKSTACSWHVTWHCRSFRYVDVHTHTLYEWVMSHTQTGASVMSHTSNASCYPNFSTPLHTHWSQALGSCVEVKV